MLYAHFPLQRISRRSLEAHGGRTTVAATASGCSNRGLSPPPLAGLDLASRGLSSATAAATAAAAAASSTTALKSSSPPEADPQHPQHPLIARDHKGLHAGHRKSSASPPTAACPSNASYAEVKKLRERYFDDAAAVPGLASTERGYGIGKKSSRLRLFP